VYVGVEKYAEAFAACDRAIALNPQYAPAWFGRGNALKGLQRIGETPAAYDRALVTDPNFVNGWIAKGVTEKGQKAPACKRGMNGPLAGEATLP
jgi:tetratricopeptide (TPR) repeat protein